jgi:hypothetical protein
MANNLPRAVHLPLQRNCMWPAALSVRSPLLPQSADAAASSSPPHQRDTLEHHRTNLGWHLHYGEALAMKVDEQAFTPGTTLYVIGIRPERGSGQDDLLAIAKKKAM